MSDKFCAFYKKANMVNLFNKQAVIINLKTLLCDLNIS